MIFGNLTPSNMYIGFLAFIFTFCIDNSQLSFSVALALFFSIVKKLINRPRSLAHSRQGQSTKIIFVSAVHTKMSVLSLVVTFVYHFLLPPFLCILVLVLCLASFGKSLGIRRMYVKWLLKVFKVRQIFSRCTVANVTRL